MAFKIDNDIVISDDRMYFGPIKSQHDAGWKYYTMPTRGIVLGGYKDGVSWYTVNKATYATDTTSNLGDIMSKTLVYNPGMPSETHAFGIGMNDTADNSANTDDVGKVDYSTESFTFQSGVMPNNRNHADTVVDEASQIGYVIGGGTTAIDKCTFVTDTWADTGLDSYDASATGDGSAHNGVVGHKYEENGSYTKLVFATVTPSNLSLNVVRDRAKGMVVSEYYAYYFSGLSGTYGSMLEHVKVGYYTETASLVSSLPSSVRGNNNYQGENNNCAEPQAELCYCLGGYNGVQNNLSCLFSSTTDTTTRTSSLDMIGHDGASSGAANWGHA